MAAPTPVYSPASRPPAAPSRGGQQGNPGLVYALGAALVLVIIVSAYLVVQAQGQLYSLSNQNQALQANANSLNSQVATLNSQVSALKVQLTASQQSEQAAKGSAATAQGQLSSKLVEERAQLKSILAALNSTGVTVGYENLQTNYTYAQNTGAASYYFGIAQSVTIPYATTYAIGNLLLATSQFLNETDTAGATKAYTLAQQYLSNTSG